MLQVEHDILENAANLFVEQLSFEVDVLEEDEELASGDFIGVLVLFCVFICVLGYKGLQLLNGVDLQKFET
jgi:hypothetical protein